MEREKRNGLNGGVLTCSMPPRRPEYNEETENQCREDKTQVRHRRADDSAQQQ